MNKENYKCKFCEKSYNNINYCKSHERLCSKNPNKFNLTALTHTEKWYAAMKKMKETGTWENQITKAKKLGLPIPKLPWANKPSSFKGHKQTEEAKKKISEARKKWLRENPDRYFWRTKDKFKSIPCEHLKEILRKDYKFEEEYTDTTWEHKYSLDIAFLDKKIAVEVNGTQHYDKDGNLAPYYQKRHEFLESKGWMILEVHYARCFKEDEIAKIKNAIDERKQIPEEEYKILFQNKRKSKEEKLLEQKEKRRKAESEGRISKTNNITNGLTTQDWFSRKEKILNSGIDTSKYGWIIKTIKLTGMTKREIENTIKHFKEDFKNCYFTTRSNFKN